MSKVSQLMRRISKRTYAVLALATAVVAVPASLLAWGPSARVTFTLAEPASYVTFNSITNNKQYGDERNFVQVRSVTDNTQFGENTTLAAGKEYEVFVYYHNNASSTLNDAAHNYAGVATGAFMRAQMPATVAAGQDARITAFVGASNAKHLDKNGTNLGNQVWDEAFAKNSTNGTVALRYVPGSAKIASNGAVNGKTLPDNLYTTGTPLGYNALDGKLPGCLQYSGYVTYRFKVDQPNFEVQKQVSVAGKNVYGENVAAKAGDKVDFKIHYKNTGTTQQDGVVIRDQLPAGLEYVAGTTFVSTKGVWEPTQYDTVTKQGINVGSYGPNGGAYVKFTAKVVDASKLACGTNVIKNIASADTQNGSKSDDATVTVTKDCAPVMIEVCRLSDWKIVKIEEKDFDSTKYSRDIKNCKAPVVMIEVCRLSDKKIVKIDEKDFDASKYSKNLDDCKETPKPVIIEVCRLSDKKIVKIDEKDFDSKKYSKNLNDCKETPKPNTLQVCRLSDKKIVTINEDDFDSAKYSKDLNDCKETPKPEEEKCTIPGKEHLPANSPECKENPSTPTELPHTGVADGLMSVFGLGSLVAATSYYRASRKLTN